MNEGHGLRYTVEMQICIIQKSRFYRVIERSLTNIGSFLNGDLNVNISSFGFISAVAIFSTF